MLLLLTANVLLSLDSVAIPYPREPYMYQHQDRIAMVNIPLSWEPYARHVVKEDVMLSAMKAIKSQ